MPLLNSVIPVLECEKCGEEILPGEGKFFDEALLCLAHYEEALEVLASSYLSDQLRYERSRPDDGLVIGFIFMEEGTYD